MVTKRKGMNDHADKSYILAKNHMVTKRDYYAMRLADRYILAKNHMVTKPSCLVIF